MELINVLIKHLEQGNPFFVLVVVGLIVILNYKNFADFWYERKKFKLNSLQSALESDDVSDEVKTLFKDLLQAEHFKQVTGIYAEQRFRSALMDAYEEIKKELSFKNIIYANNYLRVENDKLEVHIPWHSYFGAVFFALIAIVCFLLAERYFMMPILSEQHTLHTNMTYWGAGLFWLLLSLLSLMQLRPVVSAYRVQKELRRVRSE